MPGLRMNIPTNSGCEDKENIPNQSSTRERKTPRMRRAIREQAEEKAKRDRTARQEEVIARCRETEYQDIKTRLDRFLAGGPSSFVYATGIPGSGKTHVIRSILDATVPEYSEINCAGIRNKMSIYGRMGQSLRCEGSRRITNLSDLRTHFAECARDHVLFVDEIDLLHTRSETILYNIIELPFIPRSRLFLLAAANKLDGVSTRIESRMGNERIEFRPYSSSELLDIAKNVYIPEHSLRDIHPKALELAAKRVAGGTGDIRKLFGILPDMEAEDIGTVSRRLRELDTSMLVRFVKLLTLYQKILLGLNTGAISDLSEWFRSHKQFCAMHDLIPMDFISFQDTVDTLVDIGIYKRAELKIETLCSEEELRVALRDDPELAGFKWFSPQSRNS